MQKLVFVAGLALLIFLLGQPDGASLPVQKAVLEGSAVEPGKEQPAVSFSWLQYRGQTDLSGNTPALPGSQPQVLWRHKSGAPVKSGPLIADGIIYLFNTKGQVMAIEAVSGKVLWQKCICEKIEATPLLISQDKRKLLYIGSLKGNFYCLNAENGERVFSVKSAGPVHGGATKINSGANVKAVLFGSHDENLYCVDWQTGAELWKFQTESYVNGTAAIVDDMAFVGGCDGFLRGLHTETGKEVFSMDFGSYIPSSPVIDKGEAFVALHDNVVAAASIATRKIIWKFEPEKDSEFIIPPAVNDKFVVAAAAGGRIFVLDRQNGELKQSIVLSGKLESEPVLDEQKMIVGDLDGYIYCYELATGKLLWQVNHGSPITAPLAVSEESLLAADESGTLTLYQSR